MKLLELINQGKFNRCEQAPRSNSYGTLRGATVYAFGENVELHTYGGKAYWLYIEGVCEKCFSEAEANKIRQAFVDYRSTKASEYL